MPGPNDPLDPVQSSYFFANAPANSALSYQSLLTRRKIAEALLGKRDRLPFPTNLGTGLTYASEKLADAFGDRTMMAELDAAERRQALAEDRLRGSVPSGGYTPPVNTTGQTSASGVPAVDQSAQSVVPPPSPGDTPAKFASVRYNNPGAQYPVRANAEPFSQQGYGVIGGGNKIAQFPTPVHGAAANMDLLDRNYTGMPIGAAISKWSNGGRNTVPGFDPNTVITKDMMRDPAFAIPFTQGIASGEAPGRYPMSADQWAQAHNMFTGARGGGPPVPLPPARPSADVAAGDLGSPDAAEGPPGTLGQGRDAMTALMTSRTPFEQQPLMGGSSGAASGVPPSYAANVQTASLGPPAAGAGSAPVLPPSYLSPDLLEQPPVPPAGAGPAAALPPAEPYANPVTQAPPGLVPRPMQMAQAQPAQGAPPSRSPIPPDVPMEMKPPGAAPTRLPPLGPSEAQQHYSRIMNSGNVSEPTKEWAKHGYQVEEAYRKEQETQRENDFINARTQHQHDVNEYEKFKREAPLRDIDRRIKLLNIQKQAADEEQRPLDVAKLTAQIANERISYAQKYQEIYKQPTTQIGGALYRETPAVPDIPGSGLTPRAAAPLERVPGSPPPTLTSEQAKAVTFVRDVLPDMDLLETKLNHGMALATSPGSSLGSSIGGKVGLQNVLVSKEYQQAENAIGRFRGAVMQHLSGAAVSVSEAERNLPAFIPRYGDSKEEVLLKAARRRNYVNAVAATAGQGGDAIELGRKLVMDANGDLPPVKVNSLDELKKLGAGQRVILPDGSPGLVPWPKHLLPK